MVVPQGAREQGEHRCLALEEDLEAEAELLRLALVVEVVHPSLASAAEVVRRRWALVVGKLLHQLERGMQDQQS